MTRQTTAHFTLLLLAAAACGPDDDPVEVDREGEGVTTAACVYPMTAVFGTPDNFDPHIPDPIPYSPAFPAFVAHLNSKGIPTARMKTFDDFTANQHMVASLRHGLRSCFKPTSTLRLCFRARAHADLPGDDGVVIYDTDFSVSPTGFPVIAAHPVVPDLIRSWTPGQSATLCVDLTPVLGQVGDMLQFRLQDDTAVDVIEMSLN